MTPEQLLIDIMPSPQQVEKFLTKAGPDGLQPNRGWLYDPELGWVHGDTVHTEFRYGVNKTVTWCSYEPFGPRKVINGAGQTARIHTYGDSFTHCDQVSDGETWQEYLASHLREPVYNFGVGGYGVYQAYRRMVKVHRDTDCQATHVILNIYEDDHYRNLDAWRAIRHFGHSACGYTLPHIDVDRATGVCTEVNNLCDTPEKVTQLCDRDFVVEAFRDRPELRVITERLNAAQQDAGASQEMTASSDLSQPEYACGSHAARRAANAELTPAALTATRYVVEKAEQFTAERGIKLMIVLSFGQAQIRSALAGEATFDQTFVDWLAVRDTPVVDMHEKFRQRHEQVGGDLDAFLEPYWVGHHSPAGNFFTAWALMDDAVAWLDPKPAPVCLIAPGSGTTRLAARAIMFAMTDLNEAMQMLERGVEHIYSVEELRKKLASGRQLNIKLGMDPTAPDIHLGHSVVLRKMRQFQDLGHKATLIIGDYTARIGDPTGRDTTRPVLDEKDIDANAKTYLDQAGHILDTSADKLEVRRNSEWLAGLTFADVLRLTGQITVQQMLHRENFKKRMAEDREIMVSEFMYPLMQAYDSVVINADVELGGTDQTFNNLMGRQLMEKHGMEKQVVLVMPILVGLDGTEKMSKSKGNYVALTDNPDDMFGKIMSIPDTLMGNYYQLLTDLPETRIHSLLDTQQTHPRDAKDVLGRVIVEEFHNRDAANDASAEFRRRFAEQKLPTDLEAKQASASPIGILALMVECGFASSNSEARRLVQQGAVTFADEKITDPKAEVAIEGEPVLKVGKRRVCKVVAE